jgi:hypothetical protein
MRNAVIAASLAALLAGSGCLQCGFEGGGNRAFERNNEMLLLCDNGGYVAVLETEMLEGRYSEPTPGMALGNRGADGALAFELSIPGDGTATAPQLGGTAWNYKALDQYDLDHANVLCSDLELRDWWNTPAQQ